MNGLQYPILAHPDSGTNLALELIQAVNRTYFLHLLAIDPSKILPAGKSLISVITQEKLGQPDHDEKSATASVQENVKKAMQRAFWDTTTEKLGSPNPSEQNIHLQRLLGDLHEAISPLLPPQDALLHSLSLPPPPSTVPLYSFVFMLKEVLITLRKRCAPIRDGEIDLHLETLEALSLRPSHAEDDRGVSTVAVLVTHSLEAIMTIIDHMKSDLHDFLLGSMSEEQLRALVMREAKSQERAVLVQLLSLQSQTENSRRGEDIIRNTWHFWCKQMKADVPEEHRWKMRLLQALSATKTIFCTPPHQVTHSDDTSSTAENELPPQLFFSSTLLYRLQDYLQAVVAAATLRSLIRLPSPASLASTSSMQASVHDFVQRVWALLETELSIVPGRQDTIDNPLRLINLEDEVVRANQLLAGTLDPKEEQRLRQAVRRTLRPSDPVFSLFQKRLMGGLLNGIVAGSPSRKAGGVPELLKTGRSLRGDSVKRLRLMISDEEIAEMREVVSPSIPGLVPPIKGFEDPVLSKAIEEAFTLLSKIIRWTESVWGDLV